METEFVYFEIAKTLKELGYNEKGFGCYYIIPEREQGRLMCHDVEFDCDSKIKAPLYQQVKEWLWREHEISITISKFERTFDVEIWDDNDFIKEDNDYINPITAEKEAITKAVQYLSTK